MDIQKIVTALSEYTREIHGLEPEVLALHEQIRVQKSISDAHYENYCEMLKRIDVVAKERDEARAEVAQLLAERDLAQQLGRDEASAELERLKTELAQAISERTPHDYGILANQRDDYRDRLCASIKETQEARAEIKRLEIINEEVLQANYTMGITRPEPSRLEIAAMLVAGRFSNTTYVTKVSGDWIKYALDGADALIAAAKEVTK